jgi:molecular chaperone DnaJ
MARQAGARGANAKGQGSQWGNFSDVFSDFFHPSGRTKPAEPRPGEDLEYSVEIDFWDAIKGTAVRLNVFRQDNCAQCGGAGNFGAGPVVCPECKGSGQVGQTVGAMKFNLTCPRCQGKGQLKNACPTCGGEGRVGRNETVEVRIPPGAQSGSRLRVAGRGNAGVMGGPPGDLYIVTRVASHPLFERKGDDIHVRVPITVPEAILGAKIEVPTIDGKALLKIPPATSSDKVFRLRERGVLNRRTNRRGDQYVAVRIVVPEVPDEAAKELVREFSRVNPEDPRAALWSQV